MKLIRWLNVLVILASFIAYLSPYVNPKLFWPFAFFGIAYPWLLFANAIFILYWLAKKKTYFILSLCCIILGWKHISNVIGFNYSSINPKHLQVMSFNTRNLNYIHDDKKIKDKSKKEARKKEIIQFLTKDGQIDIFCGQEINQTSEKYLKKALGLEHSHKITYGNTAVISRFPILKSGDIEFEKSGNSAVWTDLLVKKDTIRVFSVHLQSTKVSAQTDKMLENVKIPEKETLKGIRRIIAKVKNASKVRAEQSELLKKHIKQSPYPVILAGDFNDTPLSYTYQTLAPQFKDCFREKGGGIGSTYAGRIPGLRIDFILTDPKFEVSSFKTLRKKYSDHYPIRASLELNP